MTAGLTEAPESDEGAARSRGARIRVIGFVAAVLVAVVVAVVSVAVGSHPISLGRLWEVLGHDDGTAEAVIVHDQRLPRTFVAMLAGGALGLAGALMQGLTRNPLADPGLLGVEVGAAAAVVSAIAFLGVNDPGLYVWFAFPGAAVVSVVVYTLGATGRVVSPDRLVLAGAAVAAVLSAYISAILLIDRGVFDRFRFWVVGSVRGRTMDDFWQLSPFVVVGVVLALMLSRSLNALALGDDTGRALGADHRHTRGLGALAIVLLCGAATAAAGPVSFVGLVVAHGVRMVLGPDHRWLLPYSLVLGAILVTLSDVVGRIVVSPGELEVGIVTAVIGAPVFIALCRRRRIGSL